MAATESECDSVVAVLEQKFAGRSITFATVVEGGKNGFCIWVMSFEGEVNFSGLLPPKWQNEGWFKAEAAGADLCMLTKDL